MTTVSAERNWGYNAKELLKSLGKNVGFEVEEEYQVDPQVYLSKRGKYSHLYTDSRQVDLVWFERRYKLLSIQVKFPFLSNRIVLACEIEASYDTKRMIQSVNNLDRLNADLGMVYLVLSVEIAKDIEKALSCLHVARLRLSTPIIVVTDLEVWYLYSLLQPDWENPDNARMYAPINTYIDVLKTKYRQKGSINPNQIKSVRKFWQKSLDGDRDSQFYMEVPQPFREKIRQKLNDFLKS